MAVKEAELIREERIMECPECGKEFSTNDIKENGKVKLTPGHYRYTLAGCPICHEIIIIYSEEIE